MAYITKVDIRIIAVMELDPQGKALYTWQV